MNFLLHLVGFIVFISGLAWLATLAGISQAYIVPAAAILLVLAVATSVSRTRGE